MDALWTDLRYAARGLLKSPGFTIAAVLTLALGIAANTAIFSVVNAVLLKPLPFDDANRLVAFETTSPQGPFAVGSPAKFAFWSTQTSVIEDAAAFRTNVVNDTGGDRPEQLRAAQVSAGYFALFRAPIERGRAFTADEDRPGGTPVAVISHGLWVRRFGADPGVLGRRMSLSGAPYEIVGIMSAAFDVRDLGRDAPELWIPFQLDPQSTDQGHYFQTAARLRPGVSTAQAKARLQVAANEYRAKYPDALEPNQSFSVEPLQETIVGRIRPALVALLGAVGFVLLIACANVANLLLVRATTRRREIAVRAALGASRARVGRQLLTESVLLAALGGAIGLAAGLAGIRLLLSMNTAGLPRIGADGALVTLDWRVLLFTALASLAAGVLFGIIPALQASRVDLTSVLKESAGRTGSGLRHNKARSALVVVEVALALVLLVGAALLIRTSLALRAVAPGFDTAHVLTMRMSLTGKAYETSAAVSRIVRDGVDRLRAIPGVEAASAACCIPLEGGYGLPFTIEGRPLQQGPYHGGGGWLTISPGYFDVFRIPIRRGRAFTDRDDAAAPPVVIISESMAKRYWKDGNPLNDRLIIGRGLMREFADEPPRQIVGIAGDVRDGGLNRDPGPIMYVPQAQLPDAANALNVGITPMAWIVRTRGEPHGVSAAVQEQLRQATGLPVSDIRSMSEVVARSTSRDRFNMLLMTIFGVAALAIAAIGIYGLAAYSVEQRTQEIGIRLALGAGAARVHRMIVGQGMRLVAAGVATGLAAAFGMTRVLASLLFGVQARDPIVFAGVAVVLTAVALAGVWLPARRAARVDPIAALRTE